MTARRQNEKVVPDRQPERRPPHLSENSHQVSRGCRGQRNPHSPLVPIHLSYHRKEGGGTAHRDQGPRLLPRRQVTAPRDRHSRLRWQCTHPWGCGAVRPDPRCQSAPAGSQQQGLRCGPGRPSTGTLVDERSPLTCHSRHPPQAPGHFQPRPDSPEHRGAHCQQLSSFGPWPTGRQTSGPITAADRAPQEFNVRDHQGKPEIRQPSSRHPITGGGGRRERAALITTHQLYLISTGGTSTVAAWVQHAQSQALFSQAA
ncbi:hypothetical protein NDU88_004801 [Pleurodeles waltl]|uniref:Uncharacterized protein n=1 Tax=Pleurodeles waltl TaxID=8319 RepID=A0AAV7TAF2_PLEWA|nr:hypothetical protein NDU88_004801 [Pleurodeles waltl]